VRVQPRNCYRCEADVVQPVEGSIWPRPLFARSGRLAGVPSPGHVSKGIVQEPKRAPDFLLIGEVRDSKGRPEGLRMDREQS
jgi:hypothetical protein